jgi:hypothetical protein
MSECGRSYPLLEEYINIVRPQLKPQHEFLFTTYGRSHAVAHDRRAASLAVTAPCFECFSGACTGSTAPSRSGKSR